MGRVRLKKKYALKSNKKNIIILIIILIFITLNFVLKFINKKAIPILLNYAEAETTKFATIIINKAIFDNSTKLPIDELFVITKDNNNEIKAIDFNTLSVTRALATLTSSVQNNLRYVEKGYVDKILMNDDFFLTYDKNKLSNGIIYEIPMGVVFNNALTSNLGPKIPVKLSLVGDITGNIKTDLTNYGINNALVEIYVSLELREQIILPFTSHTIKIETKVPLAIKLIEGTVPKYYAGGMSSNSPILSLPIE